MVQYFVLIRPTLPKMFHSPFSQEKLLEAQENRRMLQSKLSDIKSQLEAVHDDIMNTPRNDRYLELIKRDLQVNFDC